MLTFRNEVSGQVKGIGIAAKKAAAREIAAKNALIALGVSVDDN